MSVSKSDSPLPLSTLVRKIVVQPAVREVVPHYAGESFRWMVHDYPSQIARWNYHPEFEIHLIRKSSGSFIIGDQIGTFGPGHVAMVGPGLPHDWMSDLAPSEVITDRDAVIQFTAEWLAGCAEHIPELRDVDALLRASARGIVFSGASALEAAEEIELVGRSSGSRRMAHMFAVLSILACSPETDRYYVTDELYSPDSGREGKLAVDAGFAYILENLTGHIRMAEAARLAHMSEPTFSRYFKKASGLTFTDMVKRLRISNACRLLDHSELTVSAVSAAVGYRNLSNFNRQFFAETGVSPRAYRLRDDSEPTPRYGT